MRVRSTDILKFSYCPYAWKNKISLDISYRDFNIFESSIIQSIIAAEKNCLLKESTLTSRKILNQWEKIWWPKTSKYNISVEDAEKQSLKASLLFNDYLKYSFTNYYHPTVGVDIIKNTYLNNSILTAKADILKVDLSLKSRNILILGFGNKKLRQEELVLNPYVWSTIYPFFQNKKEQIIYSYIGITDRKELYTTSVYFRPEEILKIKNYLNYYIDGMKKDIDYMNLSKCTECNKCKNFKY